MKVRMLIAAATAAVTIVPAAQALGAGWKRVTAPTGTNIDQVGTLRTADGVLHLAWHLRTGPNTEDLLHTAIAPTGAIGATTPIQSGWSSLQNPALVAAPDGLRAFFGGIRTTNPDETLLELNTAVSPDGGATWGAPTGPVVPLGAQPYGSPMAAATRPDGTTLQAWAGTLGTWVHAGLDPLSPNHDFQAPLGQYGYDPNLAVDASGRAVLAWYSSGAGKLGVWAQDVAADGSPVGSAVNMPGTSTMQVGMLGRTPIVPRVGGGFYVAYATGWPALNTVRVWRVGTGVAPVVGRPNRNGNSTATIAAGAEGRLWAVWTDTTPGKLRVLARRSNRTAGIFGATVNAGRPAGAQSGYRLDASASGGALDVLGLFSIGATSNAATFHTRILPGLTLLATPRIVHRERATKVRFTVLDAGDPVRGARVKVGGVSGTTKANGRIELTIPAAPRAASAGATAAGYTPTALGLRRVK
jgi:hypothetical protein